MQINSHHALAVVDHDRIAVRLEAGCQDDGARISRQRGSSFIRAKIDSFMKARLDGAVAQALEAELANHLPFNGVHKNAFPLLIPG